MAASIFAQARLAASSPAQGAIAGINITPLVDVMLVLLVIFMVTMPLRTEALSLDLPATTPMPPIPRPEPVQLRVQADGSVLLDGARVEMPVLAAELRLQRAQAPDAVLSLASNGDAEYRAFAPLIEDYRKIGMGIIEVSAKFGKGMEELRSMLARKELTTVMLGGVSGVGKSTILNALVPGAEAVRTRMGRGPTAAKVQGRLWLRGGLRGRPAQGPARARTSASVSLRAKAPLTRWPPLARASHRVTRNDSR